jgi:hypothetical protein
MMEVEMEQLRKELNDHWTIYISCESYTEVAAQALDAIDIIGAKINKLNGVDDGPVQN